MYIVKEIRVDDQKYISSSIVDHTNQKISTALSLLENATVSFIKSEFGKKASKQTKVLEIYNFDQVSEPIIDGVVVYRIVDDPHKIHLYQKITQVVERGNWTWGVSQIPISTFKRTHIFELEEYTNIKIGDNNTESSYIAPQLEYVSIGPAGIKIPKPMTVAPMCNLIDELKKSPKFLARVELIIEDKL